MNDAPLHDAAAPDALQPASHHGFGNKEAMLLNRSPTPPSRPHSPLPNRSPLVEGGAARCRSESPATLVDRPLSLARSRPESLKNTELLTLAGMDYSGAVARAARSRSSSAPQLYLTTSTAELQAAFGTELVRTSTNPFRARLHAAEAARKNANSRPGDDEDRDWWAGQQA